MLGLGSEFCALLSQQSQLCGVPPASVAAFRLRAQYSVPDPARKPSFATNSQILPSTWHAKPILRACGNHTLLSSCPGSKGTGMGNPEHTRQPSLTLDASLPPTPAHLSILQAAEALCLPRHCFPVSVFMSPGTPSPSRGMPRTAWADCTSCKALPSGHLPWPNRVSVPGKGRPREGSAHCCLPWSPPLQDCLSHFLDSSPWPLLPGP